MDKADKRRTLYWNPTVQTDENGKAVIECYNNQYSTPLIIQAETLSNDGKLGSVTYSSCRNEIVCFRIFDNKRHTISPKITFQNKRRG